MSDALRRQRRLTAIAGGQPQPTHLLAATMSSQVAAAPSGSQCFDEDDSSNWAVCWFYGTWVGTRVGLTGLGYPSTWY